MLLLAGPLGCPPFLPARCALLSDITHGRDQYLKKCSAGRDDAEQPRVGYLGPLRFLLLKRCISLALEINSKSYMAMDVKFTGKTKPKGSDSTFAYAEEVPPCFVRSISRRAA